MKENKYGKEKRGITIAKRGMAAALVIILICMVSSCGKKSDDTEALGKVVAGLGDDELFAIVEAGAKHSILLTSDQTYDDGNGNQASILCEVYYEGEDGEAKHLGTLESLGTAYPIAYDKSGLYTAGGHEVKRYEIDKSGLLVLAEGVYEIYDENGDATYTRETGVGVETVTEKEFMTMVDAYGKAAVVNFRYGATDA